MAHAERSTPDTYAEYPDQKNYDHTYYKYILPWTSGKVLDVGCGMGLLTKEIAKRSEVKSVLALDKWDGEKVRDRKIKYREVDLSSGLPLHMREQFDTIVSTEFIEHISRESLDLLLLNIRDHLKLRGQFCGSTPNCYQRSDNPYHIYEYNIKELKDILKEYFRNVYMTLEGSCIIWRASK